MEAGAKGCLIIIGGKLTGSRHRTEKFLKGHIKYCGETALQHMDVGQATAVVKLGTIGCTVAIMKPGTKLPHEVDIISRIDAGLGPYVAPAMAGTEIMEQSLTEEEATAELDALEQLKDDQEAAEESTEEVVEEAAEEVAEAESTEEVVEEAAEEVAEAESTEEVVEEAEEAVE
jgi:small subunit ribosomal protein S3